MTIDDILNNDLLELPKNWKALNYKSYYECVEKESVKYLELLECLESKINLPRDKYLGEISIDHLKYIAKKYYLAVISTLQVYLNNGSPYEAYKVFDSYFTKNESEYDSKQLFST